MVYFSFFLPLESGFWSNFQIALDHYIQSVSSHQPLMAAVKEAFEHSDALKETDVTVLLKLVLQIYLVACTSMPLCLYRVIQIKLPQNRLFHN